MATGTIFKIDFDFTVSEQTQILGKLQQNNYKLLAFKGASGPGQVTSGVPVWFIEPFKNMFGQVEIDYQPLYKVWVFNTAELAAFTTIKMQALSTPIGLGSGITFNQDGSFSSGNNSATPDRITFYNNTEAGTPNVTVGLAALVNGVYKPFCAFTSTPQGAVAMTPHETISLFAAQTDLVDGSVTAKAASPGCKFEFSASETEFALQIADSTYAIESAIGGFPVEPVKSGDSLLMLMTS